jgi:hypothetical protein
LCSQLIQVQSEQSNTRTDLEETKALLEIQKKYALLGNEDLLEFTQNFIGFCSPCISTLYFTFHLTYDVTLLYYVTVTLILLRHDTLFNLTLHSQ